MLSRPLGLAAQLEDVALPHARRRDAAAEGNARLCEPV